MDNLPAIALTWWHALIGWLDRLNPSALIVTGLAAIVVSAAVKPLRIPAVLLLVLVIVFYLRRVYGVDIAPHA